MLRGLPSSFRPPNRHSGERRNPGGGGGGTNGSNNLPTFSYLGVPAAAGMSDCYECWVLGVHVCGCV